MYACICLNFNYVAHISTNRETICHKCVSLTNLFLTCWQAVLQAAGLLRCRSATANLGDGCHCHHCHRFKQKFRSSAIFSCRLLPSCHIYIYIISYPAWPPGPFTYPICGCQGEPQAAGVMESSDREIQTEMFVEIEPCFGGINNDKHWH